MIPFNVEAKLLKGTMQNKVLFKNNYETFFKGFKRQLFVDKNDYFWVRKNADENQLIRLLCC
jgi:hypothetical protein